MLVLVLVLVLVGGPQEDRWRKLTGNRKESICCWCWAGLGWAGVAHVASCILGHTVSR